MTRRAPKRRQVAAKITRAVLDAKGPSHSVKILWQTLWSYRDRFNQVGDRTQAELAALLGWSSERALRDDLAECAGFGMLTNHRGLNGKSSLYQLVEPRYWRTERQTGRLALRPPRKRESVPEPNQNGAGRLPAETDNGSGRVGEPFTASLSLSGSPATGDDGPKAGGAPTPNESKIRSGDSRNGAGSSTAVHIVSPSTPMAIRSAVVPSRQFSAV